MSRTQGYGGQQWKMHVPAGGGGLEAGLLDLSVNSAAVNGGYDDNSIVLRTGGVANPAGAYTA